MKSIQGSNSIHLIGIHSVLRVIPLTILGLTVMLAGCSSARTMDLGVSIPSDAQLVTLSNVLASPSSFNGKTFAVKGVISSQCASLCDFVLKDGVHKATIYPQGFKFPKLPVGKPVTVYVQATVGDEQVVLSALGLKIE